MSKEIVRVDRATSFRIAKRLTEMAGTANGTQVSKALILGTIKKEFGLDLHSKTLSRLAEDAGIKPFWDDRGENSPLIIMHRKIEAMKIAVITLYNTLGEKLPQEFVEGFEIGTKH